MPKHTLYSKRKPTRTRDNANVSALQPSPDADNCRVGGAERKGPVIPKFCRQDDHDDKGFRETSWHLSGSGPEQSGLSVHKGRGPCGYRRRN